MFIGYASYAEKLRQIAGLTVIDIPEPFNPRAQYAAALITARAHALAAFLQSQEAQKILREAGFEGAW